MKRITFLLSLFLTLSASAQITGLQTEYLDRPIGLDTPSPRLGWKLGGITQTSFRIVAGTDSIEVSKGKGDLWQYEASSSENRITYQGKDLKPFTSVYWMVEATDSKGEKHSSPLAYFETGMMDMALWQGAWISDSKDRDLTPAPYFRKEFNKEGKTLKRARAYISAGGLMELYLNGERVSDHVLDPLYTRFDRRNLYVTYDVTGAIKDGTNCVGVLLGNGWYNHQSIGVWDFETAPWRNRPAFVMDLRLDYEDGTTQIVSTDLSWKRSTGALIQNNIYTGEHYDFSKEQKGWNTPGFDDKDWKSVIYRQAPSMNLTAQTSVPIRKVQKMPAKNMRVFSPGNVLYDFAQNMAGMAHIRLKGPKGCRVRLIYTERLKKDGHADQSNIDVYFKGDREKDPFQTDVLYLSGDWDEFENHFNYKGFRYVEVISDEPIELKEESLTAYFIHSDVQRAGNVKTSSDIIQKLVHATESAYLSNLMGYPTDCPQREKNGWTGDGHLAIETALYSFDGITVYEKWMADHRDEQQPNGVLPDIVPTDGWGYGSDNGLDWTSTIAIIPWNLYLFYGDVKPLRDNYEAIKKYVNYVERTSQNHLTSWGRGDWVPVSVGSDKTLTSTCYFYKDTRILADAARILGKEDDARYYDQLAVQIRDAINDRFLDQAKGVYASGTQTELSVPLHWGVVPEQMKEKVAYNLNQKVIASGFHLDVGVLGCKALLNALKENGYDETAYKVAIQDTYPSWGWWVVNGHTTLLENWDLDAPRDISDNHMMFGEIGAYFYKGLGGIYPDPERPGFRHIILRPFFEKTLKDIEITHESPHGTILSAYQVKGKKVRYEVEIPSGCSATLQVPSQVRLSKSQTSTMELASGHHILEFTLR